MRTVRRQVPEPWSVEATIWMLICAIIGLSQLLLPTGCRPVKSVEGSIYVDPSNCVEASMQAGSRERKAQLDCLAGEVRVRVELDRRAWNVMRQESQTLAADAGTRDLIIDGEHCKENPRDSLVSETALLDCRADSPTVNYAVALGRQEWRAIKARTGPAPFEAGPGK